MKSLYYSRATSSEPTIPAGETSEGFPTNGSPTGGQKSTLIGAYWYHMVTMEIVNAISAAGIKPDAADLSQLDQAITKRLEALRLGLEKSIGDVAQSLAQQGIPTGAIMPFDSEVEPNEFWLICDGRAVSRSTYAKLFSVIGTRHGVGNGQTTFNLPDLRDRVLWGATSGIGQYLEAGIPNITGRVGNFNLYASQQRADGAFYATGNGGFVGLKSGHWDSAQEIFLDASRQSSVYGRSGTVRPPAMKTLFCIHV